MICEKCKKTIRDGSFKCPFCDYSVMFETTAINLTELQERGCYDFNTTKNNSEPPKYNNKASSKDEANTYKKTIKDYIKSFLRHFFE